MKIHLKQSNVEDGRGQKKAKENRMGDINNKSADIDEWQYNDIEKMVYWNDIIDKLSARKAIQK